MTEEVWINEHWTHDYASVHLGRCPHCKYGRGTHAGSTNRNGQWIGSISFAADAWSRARETDRSDIRACQVCSPPVVEIGAPSPERG